MPSTPRGHQVLLTVDDPAFAELLVEALSDAGHAVTLAEDEAALVGALFRTRFAVAIVDLDGRGRNGARLLTHLRAAAPATKLIALLPCGGLSPDTVAPACHVALEKPPRLAALLRAVKLAPDAGG